MEHHTTTSRAEAERLMGIAEKLLRSKDYGGCRDFSILAQETEPLLDGCDHILAVAEVLLAAENNKKRPTTTTTTTNTQNHHDWYSILQIPPRCDDDELIKKQYRRLALLLHPDKNKFPFADSAFRLVADAWAVLSDPAKKPSYDAEFAAAGRFSKVDFVKKDNSSRKQQQTTRGKEDGSGQKLPVRRSGRGGDVGRGGGVSGGSVKVSESKGGGGNTGNWVGNFWTACPYCYNLYEYSRVYEGCCLRCDNEGCKRAFTAAKVLSMPPVVPGKEAYYCCWGFFPMGFVAGSVETGSGGGGGFPKWMPQMFGDGGVVEEPEQVPAPAPAPAPVPPLQENVTPQPQQQPAAAGESTGKKKRGRPRKNV